MAFNKSTTICWDCDNAYFDQCSWMREENPAPVPGWKVEKGIMGYNVLSCPNFKPHTEHKPDDQGVKNLVYAILSRLARDYLMALSGNTADARPPIVIKQTIEGWAQSEDAEVLLGDLDGEEILDDLRRSYAKFCMLTSEHWDDKPDRYGEIRFTCPICGNEAVIKERGVKGLRRKVKTARCACGCECGRGDAHVSRKLL